MRERLAAEPDFCGLGIGLMEVNQRAIVEPNLHGGVHAVRDDDGTTKGGKVNAVDLVATALFHDGVDAL